MLCLSAERRAVLPVAQQRLLTRPLLTKHCWHPDIKRIQASPSYHFIPDSSHAGKMRPLGEYITCWWYMDPDGGPGLRMTSTQERVEDHSWGFWTWVEVLPCCANYTKL